MHSKYKDSQKKFAGVMGSKPFKLLSTWWPVFTIIIYGSYAFWPEARELSSATPIWIAGRALIVVISVLCLIYRNKPLYRELLGHAMLAYTASATVSYYLAVSNRNDIFWGSIVRLIGISGCLYSLAVSSFLTLNVAEGRRIMEVSDEELEKEL